MIQDLIEETWEDMAIRKEDWPLINNAIEDAIAPLRPRGWRKALYLLREWSVLGVTATVIVALLSIVVALIVAVTHRVEADAKFRADSENFQKQTTGDLKNIETELGVLRAQLQTQKYSTASLEELKMHRNELSGTLGQSWARMLPASN